jgi:hypothetical protein
MAACRVDRKAAKELFIRILYGGAVGTWCCDHGVADKTVPSFTQTYKADMDEAVAADHNRHKSFYPAGTSRSKVIYYLNTQAERECVDKVEELLLDSGADIQAYEHDGLSFIMPVGDMDELIGRCSDACGYPVTIEPAKTFEQAMAVLMDKVGVRDESAWAPKLIVQARKESTEAHVIFADLVLAEPQISSKVPFSV